MEEHWRSIGAALAQHSRGSGALEPQEWPNMEHWSSSGATWSIEVPLHALRSEASADQRCETQKGSFSDSFQKASWPFGRGRGRGRGWMDGSHFIQNLSTHDAMFVTVVPCSPAHFS